MNTNETIVPLSKEIDHVKSFLALQHQRFDKNLNFTVEMEDATRSILVPKMILQPLVENYFKHGFEPHKESGELLIICKWFQPKQLEIIVEDQGMGIEAEQLKTIQAQLNKPLGTVESQQTEHIGLMNVLFRLQLYFNENSKIILEPNQPQGLKVILRIPLEKGDPLS